MQTRSYTGTGSDFIIAQAQQAWSGHAGIFEQALTALDFKGGKRDMAE